MKYDKAFFLLEIVLSNPLINRTVMMLMWIRIAFILLCIVSLVSGRYNFHNCSHSNVAVPKDDQFYRKRMCGPNTYCSIYKPHKDFTWHCSECNGSDFCNTDVLDSSADGLRLKDMLILALFFVITFFLY